MVLPYNGDIGGNIVYFIIEFSTLLNFVSIFTLDWSHSLSAYGDS